MVSREGVIAGYIMASGQHGTLYIGVTSNLNRRVWEHREGVGSKFVKRYGCARLVWFEVHVSMVQAIQRETSLKRWMRDWKTSLIERENPLWADLYGTLRP
jgi:putative endonuclease